MPTITAFFSGLIFGLGLILSGMTNPAKVIGFLDFFGHWDPALAFVMLGAISVSMLGFFFAKNRNASLLGQSIHLPVTKTIDTKLIVGAAIFGVGWGLAGFCPGPAIASLTTALPSSALFIIAMAAGMLLVEKLFPR